jgi:hypothetical protein
MVAEIYQHARELKNKEIETINNIDTTFETEMNEFIQNKDNISCVNCMMILFGKREIAKNKKDSIYTLKGQMLYVESRLSDLLTDIVSFYSSKLNAKKVVPEERTYIVSKIHKS